MKWIMRLAVNRGLIGGNKYFAAIGIAGLIVRAVQRLNGSGPQTIYKEKMRPGQVLVIREDKQG